MGADYTFYVKILETHARAFLTFNILAIGRVQCQPWGHLNKEIESFRGQNSLCDTGDVWDGGCAPIFCLLVTTRHEDGRTPTDILHSTHPHRHFSKHAKKSFAISSLCSFEVALILKFQAKNM